MSEILISEPAFNPEPLMYRRYSYGFGNSMVSSDLKEFIALNQITSQTHPRIADLYAGDGSLAKVMAELGWLENEMLCIDWHKSPTPLVNGVRWAYYDLQTLAGDIRNQRFLPPQIVSYYHQFDIVLAVSGEVSVSNKTDFRTLTSFFAREGGYTYGGYLMETSLQR